MNWLKYTITENKQQILQLFAILRETDNDSFIVFTKLGSMLVKPDNYDILTERQYFDTKPKKYNTEKFY